MTERKEPTVEQLKKRLRALEDCVLFYAAQDHIKDSPEEAAAAGIRTGSLVTGKVVEDGTLARFTLRFWGYDDVP